MKTSFEKFMASNAVEPIKVEMALMDDIKSLLGKYKTLDNAIKAQNGKAFNAIKVYQDSVRTAYQNAQQAVDLITQLDTKSKDLGLADSGLGGYKKEMAAKASEYKAKFTQIDNLLKSL